MKNIHGYSTYTLMVFSVIHIGMAALFFNEFTMRVMWFVAQGLMGVFVAFLNIACRRLAWREPGIAKLTHLTNALGLIFAILWGIVDPSPPTTYRPQAAFSPQPNSSVHLLINHSILR